MITCPNDPDNDGNCHLCCRLTTGCFLRDLRPTVRVSAAVPKTTTSLLHIVSQEPLLVAHNDRALARRLLNLIKRSTAFTTAP